MGSERVVLEVFSQEKTGEICRAASLAESVIPGRVLGWVSTDGADYGQVTFLNSKCSAKDAEIERLRRFVDWQDIRSDFRTATEMRTEIERLRAENQRYERLFTSREQDHKELCERYDQLEAQLTASDGRVMVAETMLADFYHRAKDCDKDSRSPVDSVPPIVVVRHIVWQYETTFRKALQNER